MGIVLGDNKVDWSKISYQDIKSKMNTINPNIDYNKWLHQLYLFITVYTHLKEIGTELDTSCEDFLVQWSSDGRNRGNDDRAIINGIIKNFDIDKNLAKLLPKNNYLIVSYDSSTSFESYSKMLATAVTNLKANPDTTMAKIKGWVVNQINDLSKAFITDIKKYKECFMVIKNSKTKVFVLEAFTTNNKWEQLISNATNKKTRESLYLGTIYSIMSTENSTLYSSNLIDYLDTIFFNEDILHHFATSLSVKITTSLHGFNLAPKAIPTDRDILGFKNLALLLTKSPADIKVITWEQVRAYRIKEDIIMATEPSSSKSYELADDTSLIFDPSVLRKSLEELEEELFLYHAPLFWDFTMTSINETSEQEVLSQAKNRMRLFFGCLGKSMLRYKGKVCQMLFLLSGFTGDGNMNGANGKSYLIEGVIPFIFGRTKVASRSLSDSAKNSDKYSESTMVGKYLKCLDDTKDGERTNTVSIKHLIKSLGKRRSDVRNMGVVVQEETMYYDTLCAANNFDRRMSSDAGNLRKIVYMELQNSPNRCPRGTYSNTDDLLNSHKAYFVDSNNTEDSHELSTYYTNIFLNNAYARFFNSEPVQKNRETIQFKSNIFFTYTPTLGDLFGTQEPEVVTLDIIRMRSLLFTYCIRQGNEVLRIGELEHLPGSTPFVVTDYSTPVLNMLGETILFSESESDVGLLTTRLNLKNIINKILIVTSPKHKDEIQRFLNNVPTMWFNYKDGDEEEEKSIELVNIRLLNIGEMYNIIERFESHLKTSASHVKFNNQLYSDIQNMVSIGGDESPFRFDSFHSVTIDNVKKLLNMFNISSSSESYTLYIKKNKNLYKNRWLRLQK